MYIQHLILMCNLLYMNLVSFAKGSISIAELNRDFCHVAHTKVKWMPYKHKGGLVQCSRCQRPGHGIKYCNMPPRCRWCAGSHESKFCDSVQKAIQGNSAKGGKSQVTATVIAKCCNCKSEGHYASDPNCPSRMKYLQRRQLKSTPTKHSKVPAKKVNFDNQVYSPGGASYVEIVKRGSTMTSNTQGKSNTQFNPSGNINFDPSGNFDFDPSGNNTSHFGRRSRSNSRTRSNSKSPSDNLRQDPFSFEEITALTRDIFTALHNVSAMPRQEAMFKIMDIAFKYLYDNGKR